MTKNNLNIVVLCALMLLITMIGYTQEPQKKVDQSQIKAEKDYYANYIDPAQYFNQEVVKQCQISPDGSRIVYAVGTYDVVNLFVKQIGSGQPTTIAKLKTTSFQGFRWVNNNSIVYKMVEQNQTIPGLFLLNVQKPESSIPLSKPGQSVDWLNVTKPNESYYFYALDSRLSNVLDLMKYNFKSGTSEVVIENGGNVQQWIVDNNGVPVAAITCEGDKQKFQQLQGKEKFKEEGAIEINAADVFTPIFVSKDDNHLICLSDLNRDYTALVSIDLTTIKEKKELYASTGTDVFGCVFSSTSLTPFGAVSGTQKVETEIWDITAKKAYTSAIEKLGKDDQIEIVHTNETGTVLILKVINPKYQTEFYVYQSETGKIETVHKPLLRASAEKTIVTNTIDIKSRHGYLLKGTVSKLPSTREVLGLVVLVGDAPFMRRSTEYNPMIQYLCAHGFMVLEVDHVGLSGYGKKHRVAGIGELDGKMIEDIADGVQACISQRIYTGRKVAVVGSGYGGHAAMLCMLNYSDIFSAYVCETGIMTVATYAERMMEKTPACNKMINKLYANNDIPSNMDLSSAFQGLELKNGLDERLLMVISPESMLYDAAEASNVATICEQKNVGVHVIEIGAATTQDKKTMTRTDYYKKMIDVLKMGLATDKTEK